MKEKDKVAIKGEGGFERWHGLVCTVIRLRDEHAWVKPLSNRPDGFGRSSFWWDIDDLELVN